VSETEQEGTPEGEAATEAPAEEDTGGPVEYGTSAHEGTSTEEDGEAQATKEHFEAASAIPGHLDNLAAGNNPGANESSPPRLGAVEEAAAGEVGQLAGSSGLSEAQAHALATPPSEEEEPPAAGAVEAPYEPIPADDAFVPEEEENASTEEA